MLPEIELDVLHYLDRAGLEGLQMHARYLRDLVNRQARSLPLRSLRSVHIMGDTAFILPTEHVNTPLPGVDDPEMLFHRMNNAYIHKLMFDFEPEPLDLLDYLRTNADVLQCHIGVLNVGSTFGEIDHALVDILGKHLKPEAYETTLLFRLREDYALLFAHEALRGHVKHLELNLGDPPAPVCIIPELLGVDAIEICTITASVDPRPWIARFIEMFETAERLTDVVRSVTLLHIFGRRTLGHNVEPLRWPLRTGVPTPHSDFVKKYPFEKSLLKGTTSTESTVADLFVFENTKAGKKLDVFVWTIEHAGAQTALTYAFLFEVVNM